MKKIIIALALTSIAVSSCRKDDSTTPTSVDITTQNTYDDQAITKFLDDNYLDTKGNIKAYSSTDAADDNYPKLSSYSPVKLPSGVVYIKIPNAQPTSGKAIAANDAISLMHNTTTYVASKDTNTGVVSLGSAVSFSNTINGTGVPTYDPSYYYVKNSTISSYNKTNSTTKDHTFFEIEGLKEGLSYFQSFNMAKSDPYNLQGIIIVPSRAAFARDPYYPYSSVSLTDRTFVFNFQVYNTTPRTTAGD